jgi:hypothetical protein
MKNKSASAEVVVERKAVEETKPETQDKANLEVPKVCGLDGDCESCQ